MAKVDMFGSGEACLVETAGTLPRTRALGHSPDTQTNLGTLWGQIESVRG